MQHTRLNVLKPKRNVNTSEHATKRKGFRYRSDESSVSVMECVALLHWISRDLLAFLIRSRNRPDSCQP